MTTVLVGDVGGTNTRLRLVKIDGAGLQTILFHSDYQGSEFCSFVDVVNDFLLTYKYNKQSIDAVCVAVAGPVYDGCVKMTNLPWLLSESNLKNKLGIERVVLMNDFQASGYGLQTLMPQDYVQLQAGARQPDGVKALMGAGTGLGIAFVNCINDQVVVHTTEGGHVDFAPTDDTQMAILLHLRKKFRRVSVERLLSGPGLVNIYKYLSEYPQLGAKENPELRRLMLSGGDQAEQISFYALERNDPMALRAIDVFISIYGSVAGNLALMSLPYGGLYIAGGIAPKLLHLMQDDRFMAAFKDKGRMSGLLDSVPINVITNATVGLQGAAWYAASMVD